MLNIFGKVTADITIRLLLKILTMSQYGQLYYAAITTFVKRNATALILCIL